jgi:uncharacterized protein (TIGR00251 family)
MRVHKATWFRWNDGALILEIAAQPGAAKSQIAGLHGGSLKIRVHAPPVDGKANRSLIDFLAHEFSTPRSRISIVRGETSCAKTICIDAPATLPAHLTALGLLPA